MNPLEALVFVLGLLLAAMTLFSAVRTVVVPRSESVLLNRALFVGMGEVFRWVARRRPSYRGRDAILARYAPVTLALLPLVWAMGVIWGAAFMFWSLGVRPLRDAWALSGSSLTTLGFRSADDLPTMVLAVSEALIGLGLVALMISFLPTIYGLFSRRETAVAQLEVQAGSPPTPDGLLVRIHSIGWIDRLDDLWAEWERWFIEVEESHTSYPPLVFFRSSRPERSWITAAGATLDTASVLLSAVDVPTQPRAVLMLRAGSTSLRRLGDFFDIPYEPDEPPTESISVERAEFDELLDRLEAGGVPVKPDRDAAWREFATWRVTYDTVLRGFCTIADAPRAPWSSDRAMAYRRPRIFRRSSPWIFRQWRT